MRDYRVLTSEDCKVVKITQLGVSSICYCCPKPTSGFVKTKIENPGKYWLPEDCRIEVPLCSRCSMNALKRADASIYSQLEFMDWLSKTGRGNPYPMMKHDNGATHPVQRHDRRGS